MRISEEAFENHLNIAEQNLKERRGGGLVDGIFLDLRDTKEAVKILQDRNKHLEVLSQSQAEALDMMEKGKL